MTLKKYIFNIYVSSFNDKVLLVKKRKEKNVKNIESIKSNVLYFMQQNKTDKIKTDGLSAKRL